MTTSTQPPRAFTLASRASKLAQIQTNAVREQLAAAHPHTSFATSFMSTEGDRNKIDALYVLGGKSLWTKDLEVALLEGAVDMLVHCLKDMPTELPPGCDIGAILEREDPVDSLIVKPGLGYKSLDELPAGSVVGTSSVRRVAQLRRAYPNMTFLDLRGNVDTRLAKLDAPDGPYTAIILAKAGLVRFGAGHRITADVPAPTLYYAISQGALAIEIRANDTEARAVLQTLSHQPTDWMCSAERACLRVLEGGCSVPVGANSSMSTRDGVSVLVLTGCVTALDGSVHVQHTLEEKVHSRAEAEVVGQRLAHILMETGAQKILDEVAVDRARRSGAGANKTQGEVHKIEVAMHKVEDDVVHA